MIEQIFVWLTLWLVHVTWLSALLGVVALLASCRSCKPVVGYRMQFVCLLAWFPLMLLAAIFANQTMHSVSSLGSAVAEQLPNSTRITAPAVDASDENNVVRSEVPVFGFDNQLDDRKQTQPIVVANAAAQRESRVANELTAQRDSAATGFQFWLPLIYLFGLVLMFIRLMFAAVGVHQIRRSASFSNNAQLISLATTAARRIGMATVPAIRIGSRYTVPVVIGLFRPVILLPENLLSIPSEELVIILMHEMAHLSRYDHWAIVLQRILEVVLFFHPAVWFVSRRLDLLRELCCDDAVLAAGATPLGYAGSLYRVAANQNSNALAVAATGVCRNQLVFRIGRVLEEPGQAEPVKKSFRSLWPATMLLLAVGTAMLVPVANRFQSSGIVATVSDPQDDGDVTYPELSGRVTDRLGNPLSGATVILQEHPYKYPTTTKLDGAPRTRDDLLVLGTTRAAEDGSFQLNGIKVPEFRSYVDSEYPLTLLVFDKDYAVYWQTLKTIPKRPIEVQLRESNKLSVELVSKTTLDQLQVELIGLMSKSDWTAEKTNLNRAPSETIYNGLVNLPGAKIGNQILGIRGSRIELANLPKNKIAAVKITGPNVVTKTVYLSNIKSALPPRPHNPLQPENGKVNIRTGSKQQFQVVDSQNQPVVGAMVSAKQQIPGESFFEISQPTDARGMVKFGNVAPDFLRGITVRSSDELLLDKEVLDSAIPFDNSIFKIELERGKRITGQVVDAKTGAGIAGVNLQVTVADPKPLKATGQTQRSFARSAKSDRDGRFEMTNPVTGELYVNANNDRKTNGYSVSRQRVEMELDSETVVKLQPHRKFVLRLQVVDEAGKPIPQAKLSFIASHNRGRSVSFSLLASQFTDVNGMADLALQSPLFRGTRHIAAVAIDRQKSRAGKIVWESPLVWWPDEQPTDLKKVALEFAELIEEKFGSGDIIIPAKITLQPLATIEGQLIDGISGKPVEHASLQFNQRLGPEISSSNNYFGTVESDRDGQFAIKAIPDMQGYFRFKHPDYLESRKIAA